MTVKRQPELLNIFISYFSDRYYYIVNGSHVSSKFPVSCRVPQGFILGPLLFICYINDSCTSIPSGISHLYHADDLLLYFEGNDNSRKSSSLVAALSSLHNWYEANGLQINYDKKEAFLFHKNGDRGAIEEGFRIVVDGHELKTTALQLYLGVWLDNQLGFGEHYDKVISKISPMAGAFRRIKRFLSFNQLFYLKPVYCL